jgi:hypothetical protein
MELTLTKECCMLSLLSPLLIGNSSGFFNRTGNYSLFHIQLLSSYISEGNVFLLYGSVVLEFDQYLIIYTFQLPNTSLNLKRAERSSNQSTVCISV